MRKIGAKSFDAEVKSSNIGARKRKIGARNSNFGAKSFDIGGQRRKIGARNSNLVLKAPTLVLRGGKLVFGTAIWCSEEQFLFRA